MLTLDKKFLEYLREKSIEKIKIFFYEAWCSGKKVDVLFDDFETEWLEKIPLFFLSNKDFSSLLWEGTENSSSRKGEVSEGGWEWIIYLQPEETPYFENAKITRTVRADHTGKEKIRYIFTNTEVVKDRCGCGSSFSFEKKKPKIDLSKLKDMKKNFGK